MRLWMLFLFAFLVLPAQAESGSVSGMRAGYLSSVEEERHWRDVEMVLLPAPPDRSRDFGAPLVNEKLTREFRGEYELQFGRTDAERNYYSVNRYTFFDYPGGKHESVEKHTDRQRAFGGYMFRRLTEHHVDQYVKSNREIRPIYELKERIANVEMQVRKGYKVRLQYSYSGNSLNMKLDNPYDITSKVTLQMGSGIGPGAIERTIYTLSVPVTKRAAVSAYHEVDRSSGTLLVASQQVSAFLAATLTGGQHILVDRDQVNSSLRHDLVLLGFVWTE